MTATETKAATTNPLSKGDILRASWGYDQTNVDFYEVVKTTRCTVTLVRIMSQIVSFGVGQNKVGPRKGCPKEGYKPLKSKRVQRDYNGRPFVKITDYAYAYLTTEDATHSETAAGYGH